MYAKLTAVTSKLILGALFLIAVFTVQAQTPATVTASKEDSALVKYLGAQDDMIVFDVSCKNASGAPFTVIIKDQDWISVYQGTFKEKNFYKQFRLPRADKDKITFIIRNYKEADIAKTFEININSRFIQDVAVKKMN